MTFKDKTPLELGFQMPAEWARHGRCWMAWPYRQELWSGPLPETQAAYVRVAQAIARFEPVTMVAPPDEVSLAEQLCGSSVGILPLPIDDSWTRDSGPAFLLGQGDSRAGTAWHFNAWGDKTDRYEQDAQLAKRLCAQLDVPCYQSSLFLEGGGIHVDGEGTLLTTESCVLNSNRNPGLTKREVERELCHALGASKVIWLPGGLSEADITDGHVDGLACFARPGLVLMETLTDLEGSFREVLQENRRALEGATDAKGRPIEIVEMEGAWEAERESDTYCDCYINFYIANGGIVVPVFDDPADAPAVEALERAFPDRVVMPVPGIDIVRSGGSIHCITQQEPRP